MIGIRCEMVINEEKWNLKLGGVGGTINFGWVGGGIIFGLAGWAGNENRRTEEITFLEPFSNGSRRL